MVAIVSGSSLGLNLTSLASVGQAGTAAASGNRNTGEQVHVNVATGNLVVQHQDDIVVARGEDAPALRTYNSQGLLDDANADNWSDGARLQPLSMQGVLNTQGSSILRTDWDGSTASYSYDPAAGLYRSTEGAGAHDTIALVAAEGQLEWREGSTGTTQRYEASGSHRLLATSDALGHTTHYGYDAAGRLASVTTGSGDRTYYDYVGANLSRVRVVNAAGASSTTQWFQYDSANRLVRAIVDLTPDDHSLGDGRSFTTHYTYDGDSRRLASIARSDGTAVRFTYVQLAGTHKVATVTDGLGQVTSFTYSFAGPGTAGFTTVTDAQNRVARYDVDAAGRLARITTGTASRSFAYTAGGDLASIADGEGRTTTFGYDTSGNQVLERDAAGNTILRTYSASNKLLAESRHATPDPDGAGSAAPAGALTTRYVHDAGGRLLRFEISAEGRVTEHRYDALGDRVATIAYVAGSYPLAGLAASEVPTEAQLTQWAVAQDLRQTVRTDLAYDARGQLAHRTTYASVTSAGIGIADGTESRESFVHDQRGRLLQAISGSGGLTTYAYDGLGRVLTVTDALGRVTTTQHDDAGNKMVVRAANGLLTSTSYDAAGRQVSVLQSSDTAARLGETKYWYDASNRLRMVEDPTGVRSFVLHDEAGRKSAEIDGNGSVKTYRYDRADRLVEVLGYSTSVSLASLVDSAGRPLLSATVAGLGLARAPGDLWTIYNHDAAGRVVREFTKVSQSTGRITSYVYDGASRLVETVAHANAVALPAQSTDALSVPAASSLDRRVRHFHDGDGLRKATLDAEGYLTAFRHDQAGRLIEKVAYATATSAALRATGTLAQLLPPASSADIRSFLLYDGKGALAAEVDGEQYLTEYVRDAGGNLTSTIRYARRVTVPVSAGSTVAALRPAASAADQAVNRSYDLLGRVLTETSAEGVLTQYAYDSAGNLVSTVRAHGTTEARNLLAHYDLQGRLVAELSAAGAALLTGGQTQAEIEAIWAQHGSEHTYDAAGRRLSTTDAAGHRAVFFYDADGALTHTVNALGEVQETRYDALGRAIEQISYANRVATSGLAGGTAPPPVPAASALDGRTTYGYTGEGQVAFVKDAFGNSTSSGYNVFGEETRRTVGLGGGATLVQTHTVDRRGLRTSTVSDAAGLNVLTSTAFDAFGRVIRSVDGNGKVREQSYDRLGRIVSTREATGAQRHTAYDAFGRVLAQTDALGHTTTYAYDKAARTLTVTTPEGVLTKTAYTRHGQVLSVTDGRGGVTSYSYDRNGKLVRTSTPLASTASAYDAAGRLIETTDGRGVKVAYSYDAAGRVLTRRLDPSGLNLTTSYTYDAKGQQVAVKDPNGVVTTTEFDRKGQVVRQTLDPAGLNLQTSYTYDAQGKVLTVRSPGGTTTQYVYDKLGRRIEERIDPGGLALTRRWSYDKNGNAVSATDPLGQVTRNAYDASGQLVLTVDAAGNVRQFSHDAQGRITRVRAFATPISTTGLSAAPTEAELEARLIAKPAQDLVENRVYDRDGRLAATVDGMGAVVRYSYDKNGNVVSRIAHATPVDMATWTPGTLPAPAASPGRDSVLRTLYDALDRAIYTVDGVGAVLAQQYDANGNLVQRTAYATAIATSTPATQAAVAAAVAAIANSARDAVQRNTYDAAGRLTWTADGTGAVTQRVYDKNGNLVRQVQHATAIAAAAAPSSVPASAGDRSTAMAYDAANRLVMQVDAMNAVTEQVYDANGHLVRSTAYANPIASVPALGTAGTAAAIRAVVVANASGDRTTRHGYDAAGRQVLEIAATGAVTERQYDAAGQVVQTTAYAVQVDPAGLPPVPTLAAMRTLLVPDAQDRHTRRAYDAAGRLAFELDPENGVTRTSYDGTGQVVRKTRYWNAVAAGTANTAAAIAAALRPDAANDRTEDFSYDAAGRLTATRDALGATESQTYDALGRKLTFTNRNGFTWTYVHDAAGRLLRETSPKVELTTIARDAAGVFTGATILEDEVITDHVYDALGNLTARTEAVGRAEQRSTRYEYDAAGRQVKVIHPPVDVYDAAAGTLARSQSLFTQTFYDALGNAVAGRDLAGAISQKTYDRGGRLTFEVDALGYVTGYTRNAFGEATALTRYGSGTTLAARTVTAASHAVTDAQVRAVLQAAGFSHAADRILRTTYDKAGRTVQVTEPSAYVHVNGADRISRYATAGRTTRYVYDAFGQRIEEHVGQGLGDQWAITRRSFSKLGGEFVTIDALGHVTAREFDRAGNVSGMREYATALAPNATAGLPPAAAEDRVWTYSYDRANRLVTEVRSQHAYSVAPNGTATSGQLVTRYGYDAVGNRVSVTAADGTTTHTHYDALGRVLSVDAPPVQVVAQNGSTVTATPFTVFRRDAHGNVVATSQHAQGQAGVLPENRSSFAWFDALGRTTQSTDTAGAIARLDYDPHGNLTHRWQNVTDAAGATRVVYEKHLYDRLGQRVETRTPAPDLITGGNASALVQTRMEYNAFGEMTRKAVAGANGQEYFEYDNAGRLWRTNAGDGIDRVQLFDVQGNVTADIRSGGAGHYNVDVKAFASAQAAAGSAMTRRVDTHFDAAGRVTARVEAARQELQGGVTVRRQFTAAAVVSSQSWYAYTDAEAAGSGHLVGQNRVTLQWNSLDSLGSGDLQVVLSYKTPVRGGGVDESGQPLPTTGGTARTYTSGVLDGHGARAGADLVWSDAPPLGSASADVGIGQVTRMRVYKKDVHGIWRVAMDQVPGHGANAIEVAAPADLADALTLELRTAGSSGDTGWWSATPLYHFGDAYRFDAAALGLGSFEYRVKVTEPGLAPRTTATGTLALAQAPLDSITTPITYGSAGTGVLAWQAPPAGTAQVLRYRVHGSTGAWSALAVTARNSGAMYGVSTAGLAPGRYQFELLWTSPGSGIPDAHATGTFNITAPIPSQWVPPVNLPHITGLSISGSDGSNAVLGWPAAGATVARYKVSGGAWVNLPINNSGVVQDESGTSSGTQRVALGAIPAGSYQLQILAGSPATAQATANLTIYAKSAGYWRTVSVQVPKQEPVISHYQPVYETRYGTREASRQVWVNDPPYISGYDESGQPIWVYPGHWETQYYTETYAYQVQVGQTPVYARDESGNIIYQTVYVTEQRQEWVEGTTALPGISITTPAYTPGYWTTAVPSVYTVSVTTVSGSAALSTTVVGDLEQDAALNGDSRMLRPVVAQKTDRWGNVLEITDPRNAAWKTTYRYNGFNQLVRQELPLDGAAAVTQLFYDAMGRQVAVKDGRGHVNGQVYDAAGNLVETRQADGGVVRHKYNIFGERVQTTDAEGRVVGFSYDGMGRLVRTDRGVADVYRHDGANDSVLVRTGMVSETFTYDQLGRNLTHANGNGEILKYTYDLRGNLVATTQPLGQVTRAAYDAQGRKIAEKDANGFTSTWTFDYFGVLTARMDLGAVTYTLTYDRARQVTAQISSRGQSLAYAYDAAGQVIRIGDARTGKISTFAYDLAGRKVRERVSEKGFVYQDNQLLYDARGQLRKAVDARVYALMYYDAAGNRTRVYTTVDYQGVSGGIRQTSDRYFRYDAMNRQVVVDAVDAAGNIGQNQGHIVSYDRNGNRTSDMYWGNKVRQVQGEGIVGWNENGTAIYGSTPPTYVREDGWTTEQYRYDRLNRLQSVVRDGTQVDHRQYDAADRVIRSGPGSSLSTAYASLINAGVAPGEMNGHEIRANRYDRNGRLMHQAIHNSEGNLKAEISWDAGQPLYRHGTAYTPAGYDAAGNVRGYVLQNHEGGYVNQYATSLARYDGYREAATSGTSTKMSPATTTHGYDVNGHLVSIADSGQANNNRTFVNDANGIALYVNQAGRVQRQFVVNGEVLGRYGIGVDLHDPSSGSRHDPNFANVADFDFGYARVSASHPNPSPGAYQVRAGDTLKSIAQGAYGDSALWYRVAEANGLASSTDLKVGQTLTIPNRVSSIHNNSGTFEPYDPSRIEGDKTPTLAMPEKKGCGGLGKLLMVVVAVVVTIYTAGAFAGTTAAMGATTGAGAAAAGTLGVSGVAASVTATGFMGTMTAGMAALGGAYGAGVAVAAGAIGGAVGGVASQAVGLAAGVVDSFDWRGVALSAMGGAVSGGLAGLGGTSMAATMGRAALGNAAGQGIGVVTGLQKKFDWRGVAASALGAGVGHAVGQSVGDAVRNLDWEPFAKTFATRAAAGFMGEMTTAVLRGGKVAAGQVAIDAFGNALGQSIAEQASGTSTRTMGAGPAPAAESSTEYGGGLKLSKGLYDSWGPKFNVPDPVVKPAWDLYADGTPRLSGHQGGYDNDVAVSMPVENRRPYVVGRPLANLPPIPRRMLPEPSAGQYVLGTVIEKMDGIRARLDAMGEDPSTPEWLRFTAAAARGPGNWIPETVKLFAGAGGYVADSQLRSQVKTAVAHFLSKDPIGTTKYAATRYWDDHSPLEIAAEGFNLVAGGSISAPFGKLASFAFRGTVTTVTEAGETALRWTQRLSDYSIEFPQMRTQTLYNIAGAVDPRPLIPTIRNLRAEATALAPEGFEVVRISNGSAIMRYADDTYYSVPKGQYSLIPKLRTMDTMGDVFTRRVQGIADRFNTGIHLTDDQVFRLAATRALPDRTWLHDKFLSAYKGSWVHDEFARELRHIPGAADLRYMRVGPDVISSTGTGLKYEITQLRPSLNTIYSHTKKYPGELLRYVTYR